MQNFRALGAPPPDPRASGGWGFVPHPQSPAAGSFDPRPPLAIFPKTALAPLRISGYAPVMCYLYMLLLSLARL